MSRTTFARLLAIWTGGDTAQIRTLITDDDVGHMLHLPGQGERTAASYPEWIERFREANPGTTFEVHDQTAAGDRLWTRLSARRADGASAEGMNVSRFAGELLAEEWAIWSPWTS